MVLNLHRIRNHPTFCGGRNSVSQKSQGILPAYLATFYPLRKLNQHCITTYNFYYLSAELYKKYPDLIHFVCFYTGCMILMQEIGTILQGSSSTWFYGNIDILDTDFNKTLGLNIISLHGNVHFLLRSFMFRMLQMHSCFWVNIFSFKRYTKMSVHWTQKAANSIDWG